MQKKRHAFVKTPQLLLAVGLLLLGLVEVHGQQLAIKIYTTADGLARDRVTRVRRDSRGFLWFCTEDGLSRFDGYTFTNYTTQQGLPANWVDDFLETQEGFFLVATSAGLCACANKRRQGTIAAMPVAAAQ